MREDEEYSPDYEYEILKCNKTPEEIAEITCSILEALEGEDGDMPTNAEINDLTDIGYGG